MEQLKKDSAEQLRDAETKLQGEKSALELKYKGDIQGLQDAKEALDDTVAELR